MSTSSNEGLVPRILEEAVENTNEAFVTIDQDHRIVFFNQAAERIFGFNRSEVVGQDLDVILDPDCRRTHRQAVARYCATGKPKLIGHETELAVSRKDGTTFPALISFSVAALGGSLYFTAIVRDLTETKRMQERIDEAERLAALGQTVAEISHEIKNPLALIGGTARQLLRRSDNEQDSARLAMIATEVDRLEQLLAELRELYVSGRLAVQPVDLRDLLGEIEALVRGECQSKRIRLAVEYRGETVVNADPGKLMQVFLNLVKNAIEAMAEGGNLAIAASAVDSTVTVTIDDDGPGIPAAVRESIFKPFFTTKKGGSGLGLPVSKRIVEDHPGGSFELFTKKGRGTLASVTLPRYQGIEST